MSAAPKQLPEIPAWVNQRRPRLTVVERRPTPASLPSGFWVAVVAGLVALALGVLSGSWVWVPGHAPERAEDAMQRYEVQLEGR